MTRASYRAGGLTDFLPQDVVAVDQYDDGPFGERYIQIKSLSDFAINASAVGYSTGCSRLEGINAEPMAATRQAKLSGHRLVLSGTFNGERAPRRTLDCEALHRAKGDGCRLASTSVVTSAFCAVCVGLPRHPRALP
jgi:hypothetical protein